MPVSSFVEGPDSEDLNSVFARDEWGHEQRVMLDVAFPSLVEALGDEDEPIESIAVPRLLAIAYAVGWSGEMLCVGGAASAAGGSGGRRERSPNARRAGRRRGEEATSSTDTRVWTWLSRQSPPRRGDGD